MAVTTITIDRDAYELLARRKEEGQSFSQVIKAHFGPQPTAEGFRALVRGLKESLEVSPDALDAMEGQVRARRLDRARAVKR